MYKSNITRIEGLGKENNGMKKVWIAIVLLVMVFILTACSEASKVNYNLKREADEFNVRRRITVLNTRTDKAMMQITGLLAIKVDDDGDLNITIEKAPGEYVLNYAHLSQDTTYIVEQIETKEVSKYKYEIIFYPENIISGWFDYKISGD